MSKSNAKAFESKRIKPINNPDIERDLIQRLVPFMAVVPVFSNRTRNRCVESGLIPDALIWALEVVQFLSYTVLSAQRAQRIYGVRASVLLAMAMDETGITVESLTNDRKLLDN